jgi:hypothetical protein
MPDDEHINPAYKGTLELSGANYIRLKGAVATKRTTIKRYVELAVEKALLQDEVSQKSKVVKSDVLRKHSIDKQTVIGQSSISGLIRSLESVRQNLQGSIGELDRVVGEIGGAGGGIASEDGGSTPESSTGTVPTENPELVRKAKGWVRDSKAITGGDPEAETPPKKRTTKPA